jgi:light-harvesting complex I chlorophyll a/b binding protein 1
MSFNEVPGGQPWSINDEHESGNFGFDPMELKPKDPEELKKMQTDELTNGRLGMIAAAGMIAQEMMTHDKIFAMLSVSGAEFDSALL